MDPGTGVHIELDAKFWTAVVAITVPILINAWWISLKIISNLKLIGHELEGNKEDHVELRKNSASIKEDLKETCDKVMTVNDDQWIKLVEHKIKLTEHEGKISALEREKGK